MNSCFRLIYRGPFLKIITIPCPFILPPLSIIRTLRVFECIWMGERSIGYSLVFHFVYNEVRMLIENSVCRYSQNFTTCCLIKVHHQIDNIKRCPVIYSLSPLVRNFCYFFLTADKLLLTKQVTYKFRKSKWVELFSYKK